MGFISKLPKNVVMLFIIAGLVSCNNNDDAGDVIMPGNTIADFVKNDDNYSTLQAALEITGLTETLDGSANFTFFAPDNASFNAFLSENGFESLDEVPVETLKQILMYHVQEGKIMSSDLTTGYIPSMATGSASEEPLSMYINADDGVMINGVAEVTSADIEVDNGIIHAVDKVIGLPDVTTFALADPNFSILVSALTREDSYTFVSTLQSTEDPAPFTIFAPTDQAFADFLDEMDFESLDDIPSDVLASTLSYHVVTGANVRSSDLTDGMMVTTLEGGQFTVNLGDTVTISDENDRTSTVIATDVQATNGVIHVLDTVLLPDLDS